MAHVTTALSESDVRAATVAGSLAYIGTDAGLSIVDISDPGQPQIRSHLQLPEGRVEDVTVFAERVYVANNDQGLDIVDVQNPHQPPGAAGPTNGDIVARCPRLVSAIPNLPSSVPGKVRRSDSVLNLAKPSPGLSVRAPAGTCISSNSLTKCPFSINIVS